MRFGFVTCVQLGLSCMEAIYEVGGALDLAVTLPDDRAVAKSGRVYLDSFCAKRNVPLLKARNVNDEAVVQAVRRCAIDWLFIVGWSQIAREEILSAPAAGVLGMHPTLLPEGRGRAAIPWAILKGLERTGVTLFKLDAGVDTGDIVDQIVVPIPAGTDATALYAAVEAAHASLVRAAFPALEAGTVRLVEQDEALATVWPGRRPEDGEIDLAGSVIDAERLVRAVTRPYPGAFIVRNGTKRTVWRARIAQQPSQYPNSFCINFKDGALECLEWEDRDLEDTNPYSGTRPRP